MKDKSIPEIYSYIINDKSKWNKLNGYEYLYCESEIYLLRNKANKTLHIMQAKSPIEAVNKVKGNVFNVTQNGANSAVIENVGTIYIK